MWSFVSINEEKVEFQFGSSREISRNLGFYIPVDMFARNLFLVKINLFFIFGQKWAQSYGFRSGQAMMLWKCLYGNNSWAHCYDELTGYDDTFLHALVDGSFKFGL